VTVAISTPFGGVLVLSEPVKVKVRVTCPGLSVRPVGRHVVAAETGAAEAGAAEAGAAVSTVATVANPSVRTDTTPNDGQRRRAVIATPPPSTAPRAA
jgi:hypothetical protein